MAGLFDGVFNPSLGWLGSAYPQEPSPTDPRTWRMPALGDVLTGMMNGSSGFGDALMSGRYRDALTGAQPPQATPQQPAPQLAPSGPPPMNISGAPQPAANAGMSQDFPGAPLNISPQAYGSPQAPIGGAQQIQPPEAAQAMAQAPQGQNRLEAGLGSFVGNLHNGPIAAILGGLGGAVSGKRNDPYGLSEEKQKITMQAVSQSLQARGYSPQVAMGMAQAAAIDPKVAEKILGEAYAIPSTAEGLGVRRAMGMGDAGHNGKGGTGNAFDVLTQKTAATKAGEVQGDRTANAQLDLPTAVAQANEALRLTNELKTHKGRDGNAWWHTKVGSYLPDSSIPGNTDARDATGILNQIKGGAFLEAFKALKGGGAITEIEGKKATDAIARMDRSQSRAEFDKALSDYQGVIKLGIDRANQLAGQPAPGGFKGNSDWQQVKPGVRIRQVQ